METKQIIQASANVIRITNLKKGDAYKRLEDTSYSDKMRFGVITNLYNDGTKTFIEALEYKVSYGDVDAEVKVFSGTADVSIFPATHDEIVEHFATALKSIEKKIDDKTDEIAKLRLTLVRGNEFVSGQLAQSITTPEHVTMTQREYLVDKKEKELAALDA